MTQHTPQKKELVWTVFARVFFALLTLLALGVLLVPAILEGRVINYFSFFTVLSNLFAAVVLLIGALTVTTTPIYDRFRGAATLAMVMVGLVFGLLLRQVENAQLTPWINVVTHILMPIVMVMDWCVFAPPSFRLPWHVIGLWLVYPAVFLIYTEVRGAIVGWYPYWFLNPTVVAGGFQGVAFYSALIFVGFVVVGLLLLWLGNLRAKYPCQDIYSI